MESLHEAPTKQRRLHPAGSDDHAGHRVAVIGDGVFVLELGVRRFGK